MNTSLASVTLSTIKDLTALPQTFRYVPIKDGEKAPAGNAWEKNTLTLEEVSKLYQQKYKGSKIGGIGLACGEVSGGLLLFDHDGHSVDRLIEELSGCSLKEALPKTLGWTSGRDGRYQLAYLVPEMYWSGIAPKAILTGVIGVKPNGKPDPEQLDLRWNGQQSVAVGGHEFTEGYRWLPGMNPADVGGVAIASAPQWMIESMLIEPTQPEPETKPQARVGKRISERSDRDWAIEYLDYIDPNSLDWYGWRDCVLAIQDSGCSESDARAWSGRSSIHTDKGFDSVWRNIRTGKTGRKVTIKTLNFLARQGGMPIQQSGNLNGNEHRDYQKVDSVDSVDSKMSTAGISLRRALQETVDKVDSFLDLNEITQVIRWLLANESDRLKVKESKIGLRQRSRLQEREFNDLWEGVVEALDKEESMEDVGEEIAQLQNAQNLSMPLTDFLPPMVAEPLGILAKAQNLRPECYLMALLTCVGAIQRNGTKLVLHRGLNFKVSPNIFTAIVAESSQKKTPIIKTVATEPLRILNAIARDDYKVQLENWKADCSNLGEGDTPPTEPQRKIYFFTKTTGESILRQASRVPEQGLLHISDELAGTFKSANQYRGGKGSDREDLLEFYDGSGGVVLRADGIRDDVDALNLGLLGGIQPRVLEGLLGGCDDSSGEWARFFFIQQPTAASTLPNDDGGGFLIGDMLANQYQRIANYPVQEYTLAPEAFSHFQATYNRLERLRVTDSNPALRAVWGKTAGRIGKLAQLLHVFSHAVNNYDDQSLPPTEVSKWAIVQATRLANLAAEQIRSIYQSQDTEKASGALAKIIELSNRKGWLKAKDVQLSFSPKARPNPDEVRQWFKQLETLGMGKTEGQGRGMKFSAIEKESTLSTFSTNSLPVSVPAVDIQCLPESTMSTFSTKVVDPISSQSSDEVKVGDLGSQKIEEESASSIDRVHTGISAVDTQSLPKSTLSTQAAEKVVAPAPFQVGDRLRELGNKGRSGVATEVDDCGVTIKLDDGRLVWSHIDLFVLDHSAANV